MSRNRVQCFNLQPTESFPDGAPQREGYQSDRDFDFACLDYAAEWLKEYECTDEKCADVCCPQHGPALIAKERNDI